MAAILAPPQLVPPADSEAPYPVTAAQFERLSLSYPDLRMELTAEGELVIMPPTFGESGRRNFKITTQLGVWAEADGTGEGFDSNTGFALPNGATRAPDAAWVLKSRWESLPAEVREQEFVPLAPDFVVELRSSTDRLSTLQAKMREYIASGVRLAWLLNPRDKTVEIYRAGRDVEVLADPASLSGEDVLPGFTLDLTPIWQ